MEIFFSTKNQLWFCVDVVIPKANLFALINGVNDIHKLKVSDLITDNTVVADFTDIDHV